jgi:uncharacterized membrane protein
MVPRPPIEPSAFRDHPTAEETFARIEGLVGQEHALLRIPVSERTKEQHELLRTIGEELDRIWDKLRERTPQPGHP